MTPVKNQLQVDDIQAHLIRSARPAAARYFFLTITDPMVFSRFITSRAFGQLLLSDSDIHLKQGAHLHNPCFINIAFSFSGLVRLGLPADVLSQFSPAFKAGMAERASFIGDQWQDSPYKWEGFYGSRHVHALLAVNYMPWLAEDFVVPEQWSEEEQQRHFACLDECVGQLQQAQEFPGSQCLCVEQAHVIRHQFQVKEHFGFADGVSQPRIYDGMPGSGVAGKKVTNDGPWEPLAAGEFVMGYYDELGLKNQQEQGDGRLNPVLPPARDAVTAAFNRLTMNGSFLVYRKLEQDVVAFRTTCASDPGLDEKLVGRKLDGTPLINGKPAPKENDFDFADDPHGEQCPFASHVRRVNPRLTLNAELDNGTALVDQHRIIRRGMAYGPFIEPGACVDSVSAEPRGLHFFCYNTRIDSQFEFIQKNWINNCDFMHMTGPILDPIVGCRSDQDAGQFTLSRKQEPKFGLKQYVHLKGGEYFFTPGRKALGLIAGLAQPLNPFQMAKQHIEPFDSDNGDPLDVRRYVDAAQLMGGKRFVKLWVKAGTQQTPYYYFAHPDDVVSILGQPSLFTNDLYAKRIYRLTGGEMLLSRADTADRQQLKQQSWKRLQPQGYAARLKAVLRPALDDVVSEFTRTGMLDLVEGLARRLPLAVLNGYYGVSSPQGDPGQLLSKTQLAHFYDRTDFNDLPRVWQQRYADYGFSSTPDQTLMFWVRMLFLEVFLNQYNVDFISRLAKNATAELIPHLEQQILLRINAGNESSAESYTLMQGLISMYKQDYGLSGDALVKAVGQSLLEVMVGSTDTTAKGITMVVKTLLDLGKDLVGGLKFLIRDNKPGVALLTQWLGAKDQQRAALEDLVDTTLNQVIVTCLRINPVAPLLPRYCTNGATYTTSVGEVLNIEAGAVVCLVPQVTLGSHLHMKVSPEHERFIFMDDTPHACMGHQIAMLEIREALKLLLRLPQVRPAAGVAGIMTEKYRMPASMMLRCG